MIGKITLIFYQAKGGHIVVDNVASPGSPSVGRGPNLYLALLDYAAKCNITATSLTVDEVEQYSHLVRE